MVFLLRPVYRQNTANLTLKTWAVIFTALLLAGFVRYVHLGIISSDYERYLKNWYAHIQQQGLTAYKDAFTNYAPLYTYFMGVPALFLPAINSLFTIKFISFFGEILGAYYIYNLVALKYSYQTTIPLIGALIFLLLPTVVINSSFLSQCDIWYTACELGCIYYASSKRPLAGMIFFAFAFALKLQAIFLSPFLLILLLNRKLPWHYFALVPVVYILTCLPSWLEGRSWLDLAKIYINQIGDGDRLWRQHTPNLYVIASPFRHSHVLTSVIKNCGIAGAGILMFIFSWKNRATLKNDPPVEVYVFLALVSVALTPFVLPKMHDRYFFSADVFSLVLAMLLPRWWFLPLCFQLISGLSIYRFHHMNYFLAHHKAKIAIPIIINFMVCVSLYRRAIKPPILLTRMKSQHLAPSPSKNKNLATDKQAYL